MPAARLRRRDQPLGLGEVHHVDAVLAHVLLELARELGPFGVRHRDEVLDPQRVEHLPAEPLGGDPGAEALARGVDPRRRARRPAADDQHVERLLLAQLRRRPRRGIAGVELRQQFLDAHLAAGVHLAVQERRRHRHHAARVDFLLERTALDQRRGHVRVEQREQRQRLHHVGAVVARQREVHLERVVALEVADLLQHSRRRPSADARRSTAARAPAR